MNRSHRLYERIYGRYAGLHGIFNAQLAMIRDTYEIVPEKTPLPSLLLPSLTRRSG